MNTYNGKFNEKGNNQFFVRKTNKSLIEISGDALAIDKIRVGFRMFDAKKEKGERLSASIDFYFKPEDFELLCHDILSGNVTCSIKANEKKAKETGKYQENARIFYGGSHKGDVITSRIFTISGGAKVDNIINAYEGPGKLSDTNGITPAYKFNEAEKKIMIGLTNDELKKVALQGKRALDFYYLHYFGRE